MFKFTVTPDSGDRFVVVATSRDVAKWERTSKGASLANLIGEKKLTDFYKIGFFAATRKGLWHDTLSVFEAECDIEIEDEDEEDPSQPAA